MDAQHIAITERASASQKLGEKEASELLAGAQRLVVSRGAKTEHFELDATSRRELLPKLLGRTGRLRAPTARAGETLLVGFHADAWAEHLG